MTEDDPRSGEQEYQPSTQEPRKERDQVPNAETGVGLTSGEESSFEPEEDPEAAGSDEPSD